MITKYLTDPKKHNDKHFLYIVRAYRQTSIIMRSYYIRNPIIANDEIEFYKKVVAQDLRFILSSTKEYFSASLIGRIKIGNEILWQLDTYGPLGLIIRPFKEENIILASPIDVNFPIEKEEKERILYKNSNRKANLEELLKKSKYGYADYNELIIESNHNHKVEGIFCQSVVWEDYKKVVESIKETIFELLNKDVPVVLI